MDQQEQKQTLKQSQEIVDKVSQCEHDQGIKNISDFSQKESRNYNQVCEMEDNENINQVVDQFGEANLEENLNEDNTEEKQGRNIQFCSQKESYENKVCLKLAKEEDIRCKNFSQLQEEKIQVKQEETCKQNNFKQSETIDLAQENQLKSQQSNISEAQEVDQLKQENFGLHQTEEKLKIYSLQEAGENECEKEKKITLQTQKTDQDISEEQK